MNPLFRQIICSVLTVTFALTAVPPLRAQEIYLPQPGVRVSLSPAFNPPILKGLKVHPDNPFRFDFILDTGDVGAGHARPVQDEALKEESIRLIKYFLASLTVPEKDLWVNLSPYEKDRIVPQSFGQTEMGRDLLAQDYLLKQITASLIYPEDEFGKKFWNRIYQEAQAKYHTTNISVNTFNKVWIVPEKAVVYENAQAGTAYVVESRLKVMLEEDYLAFSKNVRAGHAQPVQGVNQLGSQIVREIVIPALTKEINENKNFAQLRQVYNSLILATWYKKKIKDSILSQVYADKNKVKGVEYMDSVIPAKAGIQSKGDVEVIYQQYLQAFKKGVYNYIKEEQDPITQQMIPRKYFSGGVKWDMAMLQTTTDQTMLPQVASDHAIIVQTNLNPADRAMSAVIDSLTQRSLDSHPFSDFVAWMNDISDAVTSPLSEDDLDSLAGQLNVRGEDLKAKAVSVAKASRAFYEQLSKDGKTNVYLFRDAFGLYTAERTADGKPAAMLISKASTRALGGPMLDLTVLSVINETKSRLGLDVNLPVPEEQFSRFKTELFKLFDVLINEQNVGEVRPENRLIVDKREQLRLAAEYLSKYTNSIGITTDVIKTKGVRFIDTSMRGTLVLLMEAVARDMMRKAGVADADMEGKTDSRMFYSSLSQSLSALDIDTQNGLARMTELNDYPVEFNGTVDPVTHEPQVRSDLVSQKKFIFFMTALKSGLLKDLAMQSEVQPDNAMPAAKQAGSDSAMGAIQDWKRVRARAKIFFFVKTFFILGGTVIGASAYKNYSQNVYALLAMGMLYGFTTFRFVMDDYLIGKSERAGDYITISRQPKEKDSLGIHVVLNLKGLAGEQESAYTLIAEDVVKVVYELVANWKQEGGLKEVKYITGDSPLLVQERRGMGARFMPSIKRLLNKIGVGDEDIEVRKRQRTDKRQFMLWKILYPRVWLINNKTYSGRFRMNVSTPEAQQALLEKLRPVYDALNGIDSNDPEKMAKKRRILFGGSLARDEEVQPDDATASAQAGPDTAMAAKGGIDFNSDKVDSAFAVKRDPFDQTRTRSNNFNFTQSKELGLLLEQLQNAPGFVPVIINIQPMTDLRMFLGLQESKPEKEAAVL